ncbi:MAG: glycosyl transferase family 9 [Mucilaginibacter sp.]|nr:glycosyl transferase family 9 [Mucilaginibacter sp.]
MSNNWQTFKNILCIRPDNMGDLIMSGPAIRALKESFNARITVLTSSMSGQVVKHMPEIDEAIISDLPWVKNDVPANNGQIYALADRLRRQKFDAAVIFTVYSQNPLPSAMLACIGGIPKILGYCRENPYGLLTDWVPDKEPYTEIKHQVRRDLDLVKTIGAVSSCENLYLRVNESFWRQITLKLTNSGIQTGKPWLLLHAGVSEQKRRYPADKWIETGKKLIAEMGYQVLLTGSAGEKPLTDDLHAAVGKGSFSVAGLFNLNEFICLAKHAPVIVSVNTATVHIAAAVGTPVVVLYAQTNPQHTPWNVPCKVLQFGLTEESRSKNEVIAYVTKKLYDKPVETPRPDEILCAVSALTAPVPSSFQPFGGTPDENQVLAAS